MEEKQIVDHFYERIMSSCLHPADLTLGEIEQQVEQQTRAIRRQLTERITQAVAITVDFACRQCGLQLDVVAHHRQRTVESACGPICYTRSYGRCKGCQHHTYPADESLGLHPRAKTSPRLQEICALTALRAPAQQAQDDIRRMCGTKISGSTVHREARRQGERAVEIRNRHVALTKTPEGVAALERMAPKLPANSTMVIQIDAWNIRERDHWGQTQPRIAAGEDVGRWHWVYTGTIFRLDQRGTKEGGRHFITDRGYVATRGGLEEFRMQLYAEAVQRGVKQAQTVLVLGDGAVWIWNLASDLFKKAQQRLDFYHVKEHLWNLAAELHGKGTPEARQWVQPYLHYLERRKNGAIDVITGLEELRDTLAGEAKKAEALEKEINYLSNHKNRMDYKKGKALGQPCGSGAIESTCSQYQRRFKLTGQFWSLDGDEAFLALATLHRNGRWHLLFPHDRQ